MLPHLCPLLQLHVRVPFQLEQVLVSAGGGGAGLSGHCAVCVCGVCGVCGEGGACGRFTPACAQLPAERFLTCPAWPLPQLHWRLYRGGPAASLRPPGCLRLRQRFLARLLDDGKARRGAGRDALPPNWCSALVSTPTPFPRAGAPVLLRSPPSSRHLRFPTPITPHSVRLHVAAPRARARPPYAPPPPPPPPPPHQPPPPPPAPRAPAPPPPPPTHPHPPPRHAGQPGPPRTHDVHQRHLAL